MTGVLWARLIVQLVLASAVTALVWTAWKGRA